MTVTFMEKEKRYIRKINQQGNSLSVGIPKEVAELMGIDKGEDMEVIFDESTKEMKIRKVSRLPEGVTPELLEVMEGVLRDYSEVFKNLKDR